MHVTKKFRRVHFISFYVRVCLVCYTIFGNILDMCSCQPCMINVVDKWLAHHIFI